jgi:hypothetical protein
VSIILALVIALSATFAWLTSTTSRINHFENKGYAIDDGSVVVNETFTPDEDWEIGETVDKDVSITNAGSVPVLARVSFEELLNILGNNGDVSYRDSDDVSPLGNLIEANVDVLPYAGWTTLNAPTYDAALSGYSVPSGTVIKKAPSGDTLVAWLPYGSAGKSQSVKVRGHVVSGTAIELTEKVQLAYWTEGTDAYDSWANGSGGSRILNSAWASYLTTPGDTRTIPTATATAVSQLSAYITYAYGADINNTTPTADKWYYNAADGFFYYIGIIAPGTSSAKLLDSVTLASSANKAFLQVSYDLSVTVESIEAVQAAIGDSAGWNLSGGALRTALEGLSF